jgi:hypothetical protein
VLFLYETCSLFFRDRQCQLNSWHVRRQKSGGCLARTVESRLGGGKVGFELFDLSFHLADVGDFRFRDIELSRGVKADLRQSLREQISGLTRPIRRCLLVLLRGSVGHDTPCSRAAGFFDLGASGFIGCRQLCYTTRGISDRNFK